MATATPKWADLIGKPFTKGGRGPDEFDCFGLVAEMKRREGNPIPERESPEGDVGMAMLLAAQIPLCDELTGPESGAIVAIRVGRFVHHVGYMVNETHMLHAWKHCGGVTLEPIAIWAPKIEGFYKYSKCTTR